MGSVFKDSISNIKTDKFMPIIFFMMFFIIVGIIIYLVYDYINHKSDIADSISKVDKGIETVKSNSVPYKQYEQEIVSKFNQDNGTSIKVKKRSWARIFSLNN